MLVGVATRRLRPVPLSATSSGALIASVPSRSVAALSPLEVALNRTLAVQLWSGARTLPAVHVVAEIENSPGSAPTSVGADATVTSPWPSLVNVATRGELVVPTSLTPKDSSAGAWARWPAPAPV